jgi:hypothetical protein
MCCKDVSFTNSRRKALAFMHGDERRAAFRQTHLSALCAAKKNCSLVLLHVCNRRAFRRVRRIWVRGNNATAFSHTRWRVIARDVVGACAKGIIIDGEYPQ